MNIWILDSLLKLEKEQFKIKSQFTFNWEWLTLDQIIYNREKEVEKYNEKFDPYQDKEIIKAIELIKNLWKETKIALISDYDVDWITWTIVLSSQLKSLWFNEIYPIIPERKDWYWISNNLVDRAILFWCTLIITIDNWTWARKQIEYAKEKWLKVIVTDHHLSNDDTISNPDSLINYNTYTNLYQLSWCWIAYTLWKWLIKEYWLEDDERFKKLDKELLWLVSVSIISDVCPLYWVNRKIILNNLNNIRESKNYALKSLVQEVCWDWYYPEIWFWLAPIINSMWRYNRANEIFNYFIRDSKNKELKDKQRKEIIEFNEFRKEEVKKLLEEWRNQLNDLDNFNLIIFDENSVHWLLWIVAWRIASETWKISLVLKKWINEDWDIYYHWSWRTWNLWILENINEFKKEKNWEFDDLFFAWHDSACWISIQEKDIHNFKKEFNKFLSWKIIEDIEEVDTILPSPLNFLKEEIERSEKILWWKWYEEPIFATKNMVLIWKERIWNSNHYRVNLQDSDQRDIEFIFFWWESTLEFLRENDKVDVIYSIWMNRWLWIEKIQYSIQKMKKSNY